MFQKHRETISILYSVSLCKSWLSHTCFLPLTPFSSTRTHTRATYDRTKDNRGAACRVPQCTAFGCAGCPKGVTPGVTRRRAGGAGERGRNGDGSRKREETESAESRKAKRSRSAGRQAGRQGEVGARRERIGGGRVMGESVRGGG